MADLQGVEESDIRRMGRWNNSSMNGAYLTGLPRGIMRSLAGFPQQGTFFLPRNTAIPSENLQAKFFPEANMWLRKIHEGHAEQTVSSEGFLKLSLTLRITFLQDSVFMQQIFPNHPVWKYELFQEEDYLAFKRQLLASAQAEENQENIMLQRVIPLVERKLANIEDMNRSAYEALSHQMGSILEKISDISAGRARLQINIEWPQGASGDSLPIVQTASLPAPSSTTGIQAASGNNEQPVGNTTTAVNFISNHTVVAYKLSTGVHTVTDLYREWFEGLGGNHSVQYMNANHPGWYSKQKSFYMRRRKIIKVCEEYAIAEGISIEDAVRKAETLRIRNRKSLDYLSKNSDTIFSLL